MTSLLRVVARVFLLTAVTFGAYAGQPSLPVVEISQEVHDLTVVRETPKNVHVAGSITFDWKDREMPGFKLAELDFLNAVGPVDQKIEFSHSERGRSTVNIAFRGTFECHNNFSAYPFNVVRIPVIFKRPPGNYQLVSPRATKAYLQGLDALSPSDSYTVLARHFRQGFTYRVHASEEGSSPGDIMAVGLYLDASHKPLRTMALVLIPLIAIWGISYSSQWWKEESAASRGIMASLFAATAVAIASTNLAPDVSCPTMVILSFFCYYLNLLVFGFLSVRAMRQRMRSQADGFRRTRRIGRILGPLMLAASVLFLSLWVALNRMPDHYGWLVNASEVPEVVSPPPSGLQPESHGNPWWKRCLECAPPVER